MATDNWQFLLSAGRYSTAVEKRVTIDVKMVHEQTQIWRINWLAIFHLLYVPKIEMTWKYSGFRVCVYTEHIVLKVMHSQSEWLPSILSLYVCTSLHQ